MLDAELVKMSCKRSRSEVFCKKGVLRDFTKFTGKHLCQSLFFGKVAGLRHRCFTVNFVKFLKTPFYIVHLCRLLHVLGNLCLINHLSASHSVKSVRILSFSGPYFIVFGLNMKIYFTADTFHAVSVASLIWTLPAKNSIA